MEEFFGVMLLISNVVLLIITAGKLNKFMLLKQDYQLIERNITAMIKENSDIAEIILEDLENKIKETKDIIEQIRTPVVSETAGQHDRIIEQSVGNENYPDLIKMYQQGISIQEIAERISMSRDEIILKINIYKRNLEEKPMNC